MHMSRGPRGFATQPEHVVPPDMEQFITEYVCDANREIELFNSQLDLQTQPDLF